MPGVRSRRKSRSMRLPRARVRAGARRSRSTRCPRARARARRSRSTRCPRTRARARVRRSSMRGSKKRRPIRRKIPRKSGRHRSRRTRMQGGADSEPSPPQWRREDLLKQQDVLAMLIAHHTSEGPDMSQALSELKQRHKEVEQMLARATEEKAVEDQVQEDPFEKIKEGDTKMRAMTRRFATPHGARARTDPTRLGRGEKDVLEVIDSDDSAENVSIEFALGYRGPGARSLNYRGPVVATDPLHANAELTNGEALVDSVALAHRGGKSKFAEKARRVAAAGAIALVVVNTEEKLITPTNVDKSTIPVLLVSNSDGETLKSATAVSLTLEGEEWVHSEDMEEENQEIDDLTLDTKESLATRSGSSDPSDKDTVRPRGRLVPGKKGLEEFKRQMGARKSRQQLHALTGVREGKDPFKLGNSDPGLVQQGQLFLQDVQGIDRETIILLLDLAKKVKSFDDREDIIMGSRDYQELSQDDGGRVLTAIKKHIFKPLPGADQSTRDQHKPNITESSSGLAQALAQAL